MPSFLMSRPFAGHDPMSVLHQIAFLLIFWSTVLGVRPLLPAAETASQRDDRPNVVFFLIDDLGWSDVGFNYSLTHSEPSYYETPRIDRLADSSLVFHNAYANAPNCAPSRACLLSGLWPQRHGIHTVGTAQRGKSRDRKLIPVENQVTLAPRFVTLAEALKQHGYATASIGKWHLGDDPTTQGFDRNVAGNHWGSPSGGGYFSPLDYPNLKVNQPGVGLTEKLTQAANTFIQENRERPFFLYLTHYAVHTPLQTTPELREKYRAKPKTRIHQNARYAGMIESVDRSVGSVLDQLDAQNLTDKTIVVFFSDNGGYMGATSNDPLRGAKGMLYEGGVRVPLSIRWPQHHRTGRTELPVQGIDLYPTLLAMAGVPAPDNYPLDGRDVSGEFRDEPPSRDKSLYWHFPAYLEGKGDPAGGPFRTTPASAVRRGDWKLIHWYEDGRTELYDLKNDPGESQDLHDSKPEIASSLQRELQQWLNSTQAFIPVEPNPDFRAGQ